MKAERVILSFIAILVGLFAAGVAFYIYQSTRTLPAQNAQPVAIAKPTTAVTPAVEVSGALTLESPKEEEVFNRKSITVSGKTEPGATVFISSEDADQVAEPTPSGSFTSTIAIPDGTSILRVTAVLPNGQETEVTRVVTFSTENF